MASHTLPFPELSTKKQIREQAAYGLDFFPVIFEMCDYEQMNQIAAYGGFPHRYPHWRFGMEYERLQAAPLRAGPHLRDGHQQRPVLRLLAGVQRWSIRSWSSPTSTGHCDFFKNNLWFSQTNRKMMDEMANHATHVRKHIEKHGYDTVEKFLDVCLTIEDLIDPHMFLNRGPWSRHEGAGRTARRHGREVQDRKDYMDRWINPPETLEAEEEEAPRGQGEMRHATPRGPRATCCCTCSSTRRWRTGRRTCLAIVREESVLLRAAGDDQGHERGLGQVLASHPHDQALRRGEEIIDYADHHSGTVHMPPATSTRTRSASSCSATSRTAGTRASSARSTRRPKTSARRSSAGTRGWAWGARRSSRSAASTTT